VHGLLHASRGDLESKGAETKVREGGEGGVCCLLLARHGWLAAVGGSGLAVGGSC
jgi:hypothetical protein